VEGIEEGPPDAIIGEEWGRTLEGGEEEEEEEEE